jgi:hypothetical protein
MVELVFDPIGSGFMKQPVYCLQFKTPLASNKRVRELLSSRFYGNSAIQRLYKPGLKLCVDPGNSGGANWGIYMSVELPVFLLQLEKNPLSQAEIRSSFLNLVYCADKTESELFNKDLRKEELNISVKHAVVSDKFQLRGTLNSTQAEEWEWQDGYFVLQNNIELPINKELEKNSFILNQGHRFIKSHITKGRMLHHVSYPAIDAQPNELAVLEHHWNVFVRRNG